MNKLPLIFMGSPQVSVTILEAILQAGHEVKAVVTQPDKAAGRGQKLTAPPVKTFAETRGLKILQPLQVKRSEFVEELRSLGAKALIVAAYGRILSQEILDITPYPLNVHFSLLPKYRGASCVASALLNDEKETGVTIMKVVEELDAGPIIAQESLAIKEEDNTGILETKLAQIGGKLLIQVLDQIENKTTREQNIKEVSYAPLLKKEDAHIHWSKPARFIFNQIRAYNPWPIAYTLIDNKRLKIYGANEVRCEELGVRSNFPSPLTPHPSLITHVSDQGIEVACGEGSLLITEVQPEGKNRMSAKDFLNGMGRTLKVGQKFI